MLFFLSIFKKHYFRRVFGLDFITILLVPKSVIKYTFFLYSESPDLVITQKLNKVKDNGVGFSNPFMMKIGQK